MKKSENDFIDPKWYALYTAPRAEKKVNEKLCKMGYEVYLPLHKSPRAWSDRVKIVDIPLFRSYIFVKCAKNELLPLIYINGIVNVLYCGGKPAVIKQKEIDEIKKFIIESEGKPLCTGDEVEILSGSMKKVFGKIVTIKRKYLMLSLEHLNATVCVKIHNVAAVNRIK